MTRCDWLATAPERFTDRVFFRSCQVQDYSLGSRDNSTDYKILELCILQEFRFRSFSLNILVCCDIISLFDISSIISFSDPIKYPICMEKRHLSPAMGHHSPFPAECLWGNHRALLTGSTFHISDQRRWCAQRVSGGDCRAPAAVEIWGTGYVSVFGCWIYLKNKSQGKLWFKGWKRRWNCLSFYLKWFFLMRRCYSGNKWKISKPREPRLSGAPLFKCQTSQMSWHLWFTFGGCPIFGISFSMFCCKECIIFNPFCIPFSPSWELTYPYPRHVWRWFSFSQSCWICLLPGG